jgi:hypothetical protein
VAIISIAQQASPEPNGQREFFWAQVMNWSARVRRKGGRDPPSVKAPPELEGARPPGVDIAENKDQQEKADLDQAEQAELVMSDGPGEEEEGFDLENDENERQEVEADGIAFPGVRRRRVDAALVGQALVADIAAAVADERDRGQKPDGEGEE